MDRRRPITIFITVLLLTVLLCACTETAAEEPVQCPLPAYYAAVSVTPGSSRQFEVNDVPVRVTEFRDELRGDAVLDASYYELDNGDTVLYGFEIPIRQLRMAFLKVSISFSLPLPFSRLLISF